MALHGSRKLTVPSIEASTTELGPAYVPRTGWPTWAVLPAGVAIFAISAVVGLAVSIVVSALLAQGGVEATSPQAPLQVVTAWLAGLQVGLIVLTIVAAGFFSSNRAETLALRPPRGGWRVLGLALIPMFALTGAWTALLLWWRPEVVIGDLRVFKELLQGDAALMALLVIGLGAPLSEELLFRGFLFSGLAKSRLGVAGTGVLTAVLWTALHFGYSVFGLIEVLAIGLYFSWLLVRTGSVWVTIFCHAVYNTAVGVVLYFVTLPSPV
ncbi:MAG: CPBP family intramembrane metalloprotease [Hyphomicrobium sp.]|uniref:CPBP family intramembrane glutamic endopeptidase n=1 Tax=Hyphomicrobium sp. TaxID=82 RepID=UPI0013277973|nr:type II CAAX endopeptidase family protein [Hyphomicrobium sp.]KAB2938735.1 MAG: CPBP family intramembrane metalloprotease [Hyphomicrobium sp.]MBZ0209801.1 CPBP family intramembrane metalloprotease [Hyphomicrobium sp.]